MGVDDFDQLGGDHLVIVHGGGNLNSALSLFLNLFPTTGGFLM